MMNELAIFAGKRRWLNRLVRSTLPKVVEVEISKNFKIHVDPTDLYGPSFYVMFGGSGAFYHYEEDLKSEITQHLKKNDVFFDVGANIGLISLFVKKFFPEVEIHAFEPGDSTYACFSETILKNKFSKIFLNKKGVSNQEGVAKFFIDSKSNGGSSLVREQFGETIEIDLTTIDKYVQKTGVIPNFIKVDVEGAEDFVLQGARETIQNHKPILIIESDNEKIVKNPGLWIETLKGYEFKELGSTSNKNIEQLPITAKELINKKKLTIDYLFQPKAS